MPLMGTGVSHPGVRLGFLRTPGSAGQRLRQRGPPAVPPRWRRTRATCSSFGLPGAGFVQPLAAQPLQFGHSPLQPSARDGSRRARPARRRAFSGRSPACPLRRADAAPGQPLLEPLAREPAVLPHHQLAVQAGVRGQLREGRRPVLGDEPVMSVPWLGRSSTHPPGCTAGWARKPSHFGSAAHPAGRAGLSTATVSTSWGNDHVHVVAPSLPHRPPPLSGRSALAPLSDRSRHHVPPSPADRAAECGRR